MIGSGECCNILETNNMHRFKAQPPASSKPSRTLFRHSVIHHPLRRSLPRKPRLQPSLGDNPLQIGMPRRVVVVRTDTQLRSRRHIFGEIIDEEHF